MIYAILFGWLLVALMAKFYSIQSGVKPNYTLGAADLISKWTQENNWASRFSMFFLPFIFIFNLIAWVIFGLELIYGWFVRLLVLIWKGVLWLWHEVAVPTIVWFLRMVWHYAIGFAWKFFRNAFVGIRESLQTSSIIYSSKRLFVLFGLSGLVFIAALLAGDIVYAAVAAPFLYVVLVYSVLKTHADDAESGFKSEWLWPVVKKLGVYLAGVVLIFVVLVGLAYYNEYPLVSGMGFALGEVLVPIGVGLSIVLLAAVSCVPAFVKEEDGVLKPLSVLRALVFRMPKLIFGAPFQLIGVLVVLAIPAALFVALNSSTSLISGKGVEEWVNHIQGAGEHIPAVVDNIRQADELESAFEVFQSEAQSRIDTNVASLNSLRSDSIIVQQAIAAIPIDRLHTHSGEYYVGETQFFSMPTVDDADYYKLYLINEADELIIERIITVGEESQSVVGTWKWNLPGDYKAELVPVNDCGEGDGLGCSVSVLDQPKPKQPISRPNGPSEICAGKEASYVTQSGFDRYEWEVPEGVQIAENGGNVIQVIWGDYSGTVRVRGLNAEGEPTLWTGLDVVGLNLPGKVVNQGNFKADEQNELLSIDRPFLFRTKEDGLDSLKLIEVDILSLVAENEAYAIDVATERDKVQAGKEGLSDSSLNHVLELLSKIVGLLSLVVLFSVLLSPLWRYITGYNYRLVGFHQEGEHYWEKLFREMKERNPLQPYFGWFLLAAIVTVAYIIITGGLFSNILQKLM